MMSVFGDEVHNHILLKRHFHNRGHFSKDHFTTRTFHLKEILPEGHFFKDEKSETFRKGHFFKDILACIHLGVVGARVLLQTAQTAAAFATGLTIIFTASMCAWAAATQQQRMHYYLNKMCDDIVRILACFIARQHQNN